MSMCQAVVPLEKKDKKSYLLQNGTIFRANGVTPVFSNMGSPILSCTGRGNHLAYTASVYSSTAQCTPPHHSGGGGCGTTWHKWNYFLLPNVAQKPLQWGYLHLHQRTCWCKSEQPCVTLGYLGGVRIWRRLPRLVPSPSRLWSAHQSSLLPPFPTLKLWILPSFPNSPSWPPLASANLPNPELYQVQIGWRASLRRPTLLARRSKCVLRHVYHIPGLAQGTDTSPSRREDCVQCSQYTGWYSAGTYMVQIKMGHKMMVATIARAHFLIAAAYGCWY